MVLDIHNIPDSMKYLEAQVKCTACTGGLSGTATATLYGEKKLGNIF